jgi:hypothetical protein
LFYNSEYRKTIPDFVLQPSGKVFRTFLALVHSVLSVYIFIFNKISFISLIFHLFFLILTCSCQYSFNLMLTATYKCRSYIYKARNSETFKFVHLLASVTFNAPYVQLSWSRRPLLCAHLLSLNVIPLSSLNVDL